MSAYFINFFGYIIGGLVVGYLIKDDYNNAAINGAIAGLSAGVLLDIIFIVIWINVIINHNVIVNIFVIIFIIGNLFAGIGLGGIASIGGILIRNRIKT